MVELGGVSDRVVAVMLVFEEVVLNVICVYALQGGRSNDLIGDWSMHGVDDLFNAI